MYCVASLRVAKLKREHVAGLLTDAGAAEADSRRCQFAEAGSDSRSRIGERIRDIVHAGSSLSG
jgi:hypothetical protein